MKKTFLIFTIYGFLFFSFQFKAHGQSHELSTLLLNIEKLNQLREILDKMREGYQVVMTGYNKVKDITSGNFRIHDIFLDGLYLVSPEVRRYYKVPEIVKYQLQIVKEYRAAYSRFRESGVFSPDELTYLATVYARLFKNSLQNLDELLMVITARQLRMSDDERMEAIDRIYEEMKKKWFFLREFNDQQGVLAILKLKEKTELQTIRGLHDAGR